MWHLFAIHLYPLFYSVHVSSFISFLLSLSLPSALSVPQYHAKSGAFVFASTELLVPGSLTLLSPHLPSQLHCLVPAVMEVQGSADAAAH